MDEVADQHQAPAFTFDRVDAVAGGVAMGLQRADAGQDLAIAHEGSEAAGLHIGRQRSGRALEEALLLLAGDAEPRGLLTVTAPTVFGRRHVVGALASFLRRYPDIEVDLHLVDQIVDLSEQRMDVAIRIGLLPDSDLRATTLAPVRLVTCASPAYLARMGRPKTPEDLLQHDCITVASPPAPSFVWRYAGVNRNQPLPVRGKFRTDDKDGMLQAALQGLGVLHIATWVVCDPLRCGDLIALFPEEAQAPASPGMPGIHAVRLPGRSHATKARLFIDHLRAEIGDTPWWDRMLQTDGALATASC